MTNKKCEMTSQDLNNFIYEANRLDLEKVIKSLLAFEKAIELCGMMDIDLIRYVGNKKPTEVNEVVNLEIEDLQEDFKEYIGDRENILNRFLAFKTAIKLFKMMSIDLIQIINKDNINGVNEAVKVEIEDLQEEFMKYIDEIEKIQIDVAVIRYIEKTVHKVMIKELKKKNRNI